MQISDRRIPDPSVPPSARRLLVRQNPEMTRIAGERASPGFVTRRTEAEVALDAPACERVRLRCGRAIGRVQNSDLAAAMAAFVSGAGAITSKITSAAANANTIRVA